MAHKLTAPRNISAMNSKSITKRIKFMLDWREQSTETQVSIAFGNSKIGDDVHAVSKIPIVDCCKNCKVCKGLCYDIRNSCRFNSVMESRANNSAIFHRDRDSFFSQIVEHIKKYQPKGFRWNVGGDIADYDEFDRVVGVADETPYTDEILFTKNHDAVNDWVRKHGLDALPKNLHVVFSEWVGLNTYNPYDFPTSTPMFSEATMKKMGYKQASTTKEGKKYYVCTGDCTECLNKMQGCWNLEHGEGVVFYAH